MSSRIHEAQALWLSTWLSQPPCHQRQDGRGGRALRTPQDPSLTLAASSLPPASRLQGSPHYSLLLAEPQRPRSPCQPPALKIPWAVRNAVFPPWPPISHPLWSSFFLLTHLTSYTFHLFYFLKILFPPTRDRNSTWAITFCAWFIAGFSLPQTEPDPQSVLRECC